MESYIVDGGNKLEGVINISGSKNAALPIIAATILNPGISIIKNCPDIHDVKNMFIILEMLGAKITKNTDEVIIDATNINNYEIPANLMHEMRSSVIIAGALIGRMKKCTFTYPGGCEIGARPINMHLDAFKQLGVDIVEKDGYIICECGNLNSTDITLDFPSVGATDNIMLASCMSDGITYIRNAAREPEIKALQEFINDMGGRIKGAGSNTISIEGPTKFHDVEHKVIPDRIECGTYLCMAAGNKGNLELTNVIPEHVLSIVHKLRGIGNKIDIARDKIFIKAPDRIKSAKIKTMPYPGFPTDAQSQFTSLLTTAKGTSIITENIFENRFKYINELIRMGAVATIEGRTVIVEGVNKLHGAEVDVKDLRGGAALIIAALMAEGTTKINGINYIERGYENIVEKLSIIGAKIKKQ